jgi:hypothetical protein
LLVHLLGFEKCFKDGTRLHGGIRVLICFQLGDDFTLALEMLRPFGNVPFRCL